MTKPASDSPPALRDTILSGRFMLQETGTESFIAFLSAPGYQGLKEWFSIDTLSQARHDPQLICDMIDYDITRIDRMLSTQLDIILHDESFQKLESAWRGLLWLTGGLSPESRVFVRMLSVSWPEICRDLQNAVDFDKSALFRLIYEKEFGQAGGEPFGLMVIDHEFRHTPAPRRPGAPPSTDDIAALNSLAGIAAAAFCPMVLGVSPVLFGVERFCDLATVVDLVASLKETDKRRWEMLRRQADARFLCACLPRVLARLPWGHDPARRDGFFYRERVVQNKERLWSSAAYAFASVVIRAQMTYNWPADIRGVPIGRTGGGLVPDLISEASATDRHQVWHYPPLDLQLSPGQERALSNEGFMPLVSLPFGPEACFSSVSSIARAQGGESAASVNHHLSLQMNMLLCVSRFAHYIKILGRSAIGSITSQDALQRRLQNWLMSYTNNSQHASEQTRARYPLIDSKVKVSEKPDNPGHFFCVVHLKPRYQLDQMNIAFSLTTELTGPAA